MKIVIASDHAGYSYKTMLIEYLTNAGQEVIDLGTDSDDVSDYPDYIRPAAEAVAPTAADHFRKLRRVIFVLITPSKLSFNFQSHLL